MSKAATMRLTCALMIIILATSWPKKVAGSRDKRAAASRHRHERSGNGFVTQIWHVEHPSSPFKSTNSSAATSGLQGSVVDTPAFTAPLQLLRARGMYFVNIDVGTPPVPFQAFVDTGSDLTYVGHPGGRPRISTTVGRSTTLTAWPCDDSCRAIDYSNGCLADTICKFKAEYNDGDEVKGVLISDSVHIGGHMVIDGAADVLTQPIGLTNRGPPMMPSALGLGAGRDGIVERTSETLWFCLPPADGDAGFVGLGPSAPHALPEDMVFVDLLVRGHMYVVPLTGISVNGVLLPIPDSAFAATNRSGGTVLDNGSTLSWLPATAYAPLLAAFRTAAQLANLTPAPPHVGPNSVFDACYRIPPSPAVNMPIVDLHFPHAVTLPLARLDNVFFKISEDLFCLGFLEQPANEAFAILGAAQLQHYLVDIDLTTKKVGFSPDYC